MEGFNGPHNLGSLSRIGSAVQSQQTHLQGVSQSIDWPAGSHDDVKSESLLARLQGRPPNLWEGQGRPSLGTGFADQPLGGLARQWPSNDLAHGSLPIGGPGTVTSGNFQYNDGLWPENVASMFEGQVPGDLGLPPQSSGASVGGGLPGLGYETSPSVTPSLHSGHVTHGFGAANLPGFSPLVNGHQSGLAGGLESAHLGLLGMDLANASSLQAADLQQQQLYWQEVERQRGYGQALTEQQLQALKYLQAQNAGYSRWGAARGLDTSRTVYGHQGLLTEPHHMPGAARVQMQPVNYLGNTASGVQQSLHLPQSFAKRANDELLAQLFPQRRNVARPSFPGQVNGQSRPAGYKNTSTLNRGRGGPNPQLNIAGQQRLPPAQTPQQSKNSSQTTPRGLSGERTYIAGAKPKVPMEELNALLLQAVVDLEIKDEQMESYKATFEAVKSILHTKWPHANVHLFGSTANGMALAMGNDIDVCIEILDLPDEQAAKAQIVSEMDDLFTQANIDVLKLPKARVPVAKVTMPETQTKVDITVNTILWIINTKLLEDYSKIDGRLRQLAIIVKYWAKRRQVNDCFRGTLSSYCYVLMCIHFLQQRDPPILPCLHSVGEKDSYFSRMVGQWKCEYMDQVEKLQDFGAANKESLADLVWGFFEYWAWKHDYNNAVISVRTGSYLSKSQKEWTRRVGSERHLVCIEDPFETTHDLGRNVDRQTSGVLHKEFERAASVLRDSTEEPLEKLFEVFKAGKTE
eukprot:jgi/Botrbrau1/23367/Bobra.0051s0020.1